MLPYFCKNYCHPGSVHRHWYRTSFCSCNIWRGWLDSSHWSHVSIGLRNWSLRSSQRRNTWTGVVNRNDWFHQNDGSITEFVCKCSAYLLFAYLHGNKVDGYGDRISCIYSFVFLLNCCLEWFFDPTVNLFAKENRLVQYVHELIIKSCLIPHL